MPVIWKKLVESATSVPLAGCGTAGAPEAAPHRRAPPLAEKRSVMAPLLVMKWSDSHTADCPMRIMLRGVGLAAIQLPSTATMETS